jgi:hypothetical protein
MIRMLDAGCFCSHLRGAASLTFGTLRRYCTLLWGPACVLRLALLGPSSLADDHNGDYVEVQVD